LFADPLINALILLASLVVLDRASDLIVTNAVKISDAAGFGKTKIGFVLVALCSSLPALSVSIIASLTGRLDMAVGNAIGSNLANVSLILGFCLILTALKKLEKTRPLSYMTREELLSLYFGLFVGSAVPLTLIYVGYASGFVGIFLLAVFLVYTYQLLTRRDVQQKPFSKAEPKPDTRKHMSLAIISCIVMVVAAYFMVDSASAIAEYMHVNRIIIGSTIIAFGTSVSVLLTSVRAILRGHADVSLGNIIGTLFVNTALVLGASFVVWVSNANMTAYSNLFMFSVIANLFVWYFLSREKLGWREGAVLMLMYFIFLVMSFGGYRP
jgi:cation:H+ antiporter